MLSAAGLLLLLTTVLSESDSDLMEKILLWKQREYFSFLAKSLGTSESARCLA